MSINSIYETFKGEYQISTNRSKLQLDVIQQFLNQESYWAQDRTSERIQKTIQNSLCFGVYDQEQNQVGFARIVTDYATFGYVCDVFIISEYRKRGLSKWLMKTIIECPLLAEIHLLTLYTKDAQGLYEQVGFARLDNPERFDKYMELFRKSNEVILQDSCQEQKTK